MNVKVLDNNLNNEKMLCIITDISQSNAVVTTPIRRGNMINILICDDDIQFVSQLKNEVELAMGKKGLQTKILTFYGAETIGSEAFSNCDIAFLDIDFEGKDYNGIDVARKIRATQNDAVIVFITNYIEYAPEGYEVQAFRYLFKSEITQKLGANIDSILKQIRTAKSDIKIKSDGELISVEIQDILFVESTGHKLSFHVTNKKVGAEKMYSCYSTLAKMETELIDRGFLRIHKSYLVNMRHIEKLNCNEAILDNGITLRVGSKNYSNCKNTYLLWRGQH